ncbi:MAG TPA: hypothetical protein VEI82_01575 [Myxococcota bacterium]|nr:hypothetical protein [Myxococcota bacterium]
MSAAGGRVSVGGVEGVLLARSERGDKLHRVVLVNLDDRAVVVKIYGRKRARLATAVRGFGHRFLVGKSGLGARERRDTEARLLALWRAHGFAVPELLALDLPEPIAEPHLLLEWVEGPAVDARLRDGSDAELERALGRFAAEWSRRHALAEARAEPGLVHAHPSFAHLVERAGEFVTLDFEYAYTDRSRVAQLVDVEIAGFVASLQRAAGVRAERLLHALVAGYPERGRLERAARLGALGRFRALEGIARALPGLRGRGPRKLRDSIAALGAALASGR